jgi:hypothetical protein
MEEQALWKTRFSPSREGLLTLESSDLACGAVLFLREASMGRVLMVQKAPREGYKFSDLWVLPGGMIRTMDSKGEEPLEESLEECGSRFVQKRVALETGLALERRALRALRSQVPPPVTCYEAKGRTRYTLVLPFSHEPLPSAPMGLAPHCSSIQAVRWCDPVECWGEIAPANQIILANGLWNQWSEKQQDWVRPGLEEAREQCTRWAQEVGFEPPGLPF